MHQFIKSGIIGGALLGAGLFVTTPPVQATVVSGNLSVEANPFDVNNDGVVSPGEATMTSGTIGGGTVTAQYPLDNLVNRHDTSNDAEAARLISSDGATTAFMQYTAATSFNAGTVIGDQFVYGPFANATPYTLKLDGTTVQTGPGTPGTHPIQVTTLNSVVNVSTLRLEEGMSTYGPSGSTYAIMNEVLILPKRLNYIPATVTQTAGASWFGAPQAVSDLDGYGWGGTGNPTLKLDFGAAKLVSTLVLANFDSSGGPVDFNIYDDTHTLIGNVQMAGGAYGEYTPVDLVTPVSTSSLTFEFSDVGGSGHSAMREIMVFSEVVPEPSTFALLGLGGLFLWRRVRKSRTA